MPLLSRNVATCIPKTGGKQKAVKLLPAVSQLPQVLSWLLRTQKSTKHDLSLGQVHNLVDETQMQINGIRYHSHDMYKGQWWL